VEVRGTTTTVRPRRVKEVPAKKPAKRAATNRVNFETVAPAKTRDWTWIACICAVLATVIAYWPALRGEFVFDDVNMPFASAHPDSRLMAWIGGVRPLTGFSFWLNFLMSGTDPLGYHLTNILLHIFTGFMVFLIVRKVLEFASVPERRRTIVALFCGALFLLHPIQTEAVAYISSRTENLSVALAFAAWACFLYRRSNAINVRTVLFVALLFGAAATAKEHVAVLPLVILLTDYYWNPGFSFEGVRRNWRLYGTFAVVGLIVGAFLFSYLAHAPTVGLNIKEFTWYQYLFTQFRVVFIYLRLFLLPFGQNADYDIELSHTLLEHGAIFGMIALMAVTAAAIVWRKRFPIASFGFFVALIFFLPTSSFMPIKDLATERRLYLPMIGLLLMTSEILVRPRWEEKRLLGTLASIVVIAGALTWARSHVWESSIAMWSDAVENAPQKARAHFGLAMAELKAHRFNEAVQHYQIGSKYQKYGSYYGNWALALEGCGRVTEAIQVAQKGIEMTPGAPTYHILARLEARYGDRKKALDLLDKGEKYDPSFVSIPIERGNILNALNRKAEACAAYQRALAIDPQNLLVFKAVVGCSGSH